MTEDLKALLKEYYQDILKMNGLLEWSGQKVQKFESTDYTPEEFEALEAFTARYSRLTDFFTSKFLRTILTLLRDDSVAFIDRVNFLEKMEVIDSAANLIEMRDLRNSIVHDYWIEEVKANFIRVRKMANPLLKEVNQAITFCEKRGWL